MTEQATDTHIAYLRLLAARMERLSADSIWARRASGLRRSLIKALDAKAETGEMELATAELLTNACLDILRKAALEIPDPEAFFRAFQS